MEDLEIFTADGLNESVAQAEEAERLATEAQYLADVDAALAKDREKAEEAAQVAEGYRELADLIEAHPSLCPGRYNRDVSLYTWTQEAEGLAWIQDRARELAPCLKSVDDYYYRLSREFSGGVVMKIGVSREVVCTKVVVGTEERTVTEVDLAKVAEMAKVAESELPMKTTTTIEEKVEWICPPSLLGKSNDG